MKPISVDRTTELNTHRGGDRLGELLGALAVFAPPERVIHVGVGSKQSASTCWLSWPITEAVVVDAEEENFEFVELRLNPNIKLTKHTGVVADVAGPVDYFVANNLSENSLVDPALLKGVWPSLVQSHRSKKDALTIDQLVSEMPIQSWLIIDCLPAVNILSGANNVLKDTTLVCVRAIAEAGFRGEPAGADVSRIDTWLGERGFNRLAFIAGLNPKIGHAIYARSAEKPAALRASAAELDQERKRNEQLQATLIESDAMLQTRSSEVETRISQIARLNEELGNASAQRDQFAAQLQVAAQNLQASEERSAQLAQQLDTRVDELEQVRSRSEQLDAELVEREARLQAEIVKIEARTSQIGKLNEELGNASAQRDQLATQLQFAAQNLQASEERSAQVAQQLHARSAELEQERSRSEQLQVTLTERDAALHARLAEIQVNTAQITKLNEQFADLTSERNSLVESFKSAQQNLQSFEQAVSSLRSELDTEVANRERLIAENQELIHRQKLMNEELVKAEGQISLIKDLLLREQGL